MPTSAAEPAAAIASNRPAPPIRRIAKPIKYQSHPSPARVAATDHRRTHFGAGHLLTLRISLWSPEAISCSILCETVMNSPPWTSLSEAHQLGSSSPNKGVTLRTGQQRASQLDACSVEAAQSQFDTYPTCRPKAITTR